MNNKKYFLITTILFSIFNSTSLFSVESKKTFIYCSEGSPSAFNPQVSTDGTSNNASTHTVYNRLVEFKYGTTILEPSLASHWKISKDKLTYTFFLRKDVKFHSTKYFTPTRNFNADDVLFSLNRQLIKTHPYHKIGGGQYQYFYGMEMHKLIKKVSKKSKYIIEIKLNYVEAPFLANMAMSFMSILSKEYADTLTMNNKMEDIDYFPIGTGPFIYKKYIKDTLIRYIKNTYYFKKHAKVDQLVFSITPEPNVRFLKLKVGECNLIIDPSPADIPYMKKEKDIKLIHAPGMNIAYLAMNVEKAPFNKPLFRKAINMALNRDTLIKAIYHGTAIPALYPLPPTVWGYPKDGVKQSYNPIDAKKIIDSLNLTEKEKNLELWTLPVSRPYNPNGKKMGELMQEDFRKIGINIKLISYDWPTYLKKARLGTHQFIQLGWTGDNGDPDNFLAVLLSCASIDSGSNVARWCNKDFDNLIIRAKKLTDIKTRQNLYIKAQKIFREELPWAPIAHSSVYRAMSTNVVGYKIDPLGGDIFSEVDLVK